MLIVIFAFLISIHFKKQWVKTIEELKVLIKLTSSFNILNALEAEKRGYKLNDDDLSEANQERINCEVKTCPLWMFRIGKNPYTSGGTGNTDALIEYRKTKTNREE